MYPLAPALCFCCAALLCSAEIIDRIAISAGNQVITESQIQEEIRVTAFQNRQKPDYGAGQRTAAGERLIEQTLVKREMELSHYPLPEPQESAALENRITDKELADAGLTRDELTRHLVWQLTLLRFIEYRFKPSVQIPESAIRDYYDNKIKVQEPTPTLEESRVRIEAILTEERADAALDRWLAETRKQIRIVYHPEAFQ